MRKKIIGIDIGGTKIRGVLWSAGHSVRSIAFSTPKDKKTFIKRLETIAKQLSRGKTAPIGIGAAGIINKTSISFSPNIPYLKNFDFKKLWPDRSLFLDNDARCFARAEVILGAGKKFKKVFALTIGTGIGRAFAKHGKVVKIKRFEYPEKWEKEYQRIRSASRRTKNDALLAEFLGAKLAPLISRFKPDVVIIGGGVAKRRGFLKKIELSLKRNGIYAKINKSQLGKNAVALGAIIQFRGLL